MKIDYKKQTNANRYFFILKVARSCRTLDQLNNCYDWISSLAITNKSMAPYNINDIANYCLQRLIDGEHE